MIDRLAMHDIAKAEGKALGDVWLKRWPQAVAGLARNIALSLFGHDAHGTKKGGSSQQHPASCRALLARPTSSPGVVARAYERLHLWRTGGMRVGPITAAESQDPNGWGASSPSGRGRARQAGAAKANVFV
jgi:hypothetical protein